MSESEDSGSSLSGCFSLLVIAGLIYWFNPYDIFGSEEEIAEAEAKEVGLVRPTDQLYLEKNTINFMKAYKAGANDIKKSQQYVNARVFQTKFADSFGYDFNNWVGKIDDIRTDKGGEFLEGFSVKSLSGNINYEIGGFGQGTGTIYYKSNCNVGTINTTIVQGSDLYNSIAEFAEGEMIYFSGTFFRSHDDRKDRCAGSSRKVSASNKKPGLFEKSASESGYMGNPEFLVRFSHVGSSPVTDEKLE